MNTDNNQLVIPGHVAIILDGNRRWAKKNGLSPSEGHLHGFYALEKLSQYAFSKGIKVLSVYAFSTENFKREQAEVDYLMDLFVKGFKQHFKTLRKKNVKIVFSGRREPLPEKVLKVMDEAVLKTKDNTSGIFNVCINYGGHSEMVDATKKVCQKVVAGELKLEDITEDIYEKNLYNELPPVDLMIRTSGEQRLSNFLLWQNAYAEFYFSEVEFPEFDDKELDKAIEEFSSRSRRFGG